VAANLLGFTNIDNQGIEGVEKSFNAQLTGKPGAGWCVKIVMARD
jgi:cell division protein FtsI (penicillin-binding protein 3)